MCRYTAQSQKYQTCSVAEMQIKATMRHHYAPVRVTKIQSTDDTKASTDTEQQEGSFPVSGKAQWRNHFGGQFLTKPNLL